MRTVAFFVRLQKPKNVVKVSFLTMILYQKKNLQISGFILPGKATETQIQRTCEEILSFDSEERATTITGDFTIY
jgi:hypothetical protein